MVKSPLLSGFAGRLAQWYKHRSRLALKALRLEGGCAEQVQVMGHGFLVQQFYEKSKKVCFFRRNHSGHNLVTPTPVP